jgi:hypothetical protein
MQMLPEAFTAGPLPELPNTGARSVWKKAARRRPTWMGVGDQPLVFHFIGMQDRLGRLESSSTEIAAIGKNVGCKRVPVWGDKRQDNGCVEGMHTGSLIGM